MSEWQPAVLATKEHLLQFHTKDPGRVSAHAGQIIRVQKLTTTDSMLFKIKALMFLHLGCKGEYLQVHPDDAKRLWPDDEDGETPLVLCEHSVMTD